MHNARWKFWQNVKKSFWCCHWREFIEEFKEWFTEESRFKYLWTLLKLFHGFRKNSAAFFPEIKNGVVDVSGHVTYTQLDILFIPEPLIILSKAEIGGMLEKQQQKFNSEFDNNLKFTVQSFRIVSLINFECLYF